MSDVKLASFLQKVEVAGCEVCPTCWAYKMDSTVEGSDMRASVGLGTCSCCDYFTFVDRTPVMIEETQLNRKIEQLKKEFAQDICEDRVEERISDHLKKENKLKVYGSLLVLWRLAMVIDDGQEAKALSRRANYWIVASGSSGGDDMIFFDRLRDVLKYDLRSALTGKVVGDVEIVPAKALGNRLPTKPTVT